MYILISPFSVLDNCNIPWSKDSVAELYMVQLQNG